MSISAYLREIGRGREGARALSREQAADLMGQLLDGTVGDLQVGAFCLAMRIKGETPEEMAGFLDATQTRLSRVPAPDAPTVVLPSYNGARKLPGLLPLLALLLARQGLAVLIHGTATESSRVYTSEVLKTLDITAMSAIENIAPGQVAFVPTVLLCPGLQRLLDVRRVVGLRNPAHSLVKLMNPLAGRAVLVSSYTHPEYAQSMAHTLALTQADALLLRGTEGEPVADARRLPAMTGFRQGQPVFEVQAQVGSLTSLPEWPAGPAAAATADYIRAVLAGRLGVPAPLSRQIQCITQLTQALSYGSSDEFKHVPSK